MMNQVNLELSQRNMDMFFDEAEEDVQTVTDSKKYLTFVSNGLGFAIPSDFVIEIINEHTVTHLPRVPGFIKGIINLRGQIIPIIDVRMRMGHPVVEYTKEACVIVISINQNSVGLYVDKVLQMVDIADDMLNAPPQNNQQEFVNGITHLDDAVYLLLDCKLLLQ